MREREEPEPLELPRLRRLSRLLRQSADRPCWYSWPMLLERTAPVAVSHHQPEEQPGT